MAIARWLFLLLGLGAIACFALYIVTGQARYRVWGLTVVKGAVGAGLLFFAALAIERLVAML